MNQPLLQRRYIWPAPLRLSHWLLALSLTGLLISGWFMGHVARYYLLAYDLHYIFAYLLGLAVAVRGYLFARERKGAACLKDLLPDRRQWPAIRAMLRFYVTLGKTTLPRWYAHNPLWAPVYLLLWLLLLVQLVSGFLLGSGQSHLGLNLFDLHSGIALLLFWFVLLHLLAVFVHDLKGGNSDASAMIHGHRVFVTPSLDAPSPLQRVDLADLTGRQDSP